MPDPQPYVPVVIIGAGRSGTNMLRDVLVQLPGAGTWPCDEINYLWRHGNATHPHDELDPPLARPAVRRFVRRAFARLARNGGFSHVVEKTCANSLRVGFVHRILPEARFVFLIRDGRDVTASAMERWRAPLDLPYLLRKARFVPPADVPYYAVRYLWTRVYRLVSRERRLSSWGPRFRGMDEAARKHDLPVLCAHQWARCVEKAEEGLADVPQNQVYRLRYEDFVRAPEPLLRDLARFLGTCADNAVLARCASHVSPASMGQWRSRLTEDQYHAIEPVLRATLSRHGYGANAESPGG